jgi:hypothetical protein
MSLSPMVSAMETQHRVRRPAWRYALALAVVAGMMTAGVANAAPPPAAPDFGPNVKIVDPSMSTASIQALFDGISATQISDDFGDGRYAILVKPGTYGADVPLNTRIGYYTDVAGLGALPTDVQFTGTIDAYNQCDSAGSCVASNNFWRSISNMTINVAGKGACQYGEFWAVSQATSLRRVNVNGYSTLMDYCSGPSWASGGFIADSVMGGITSGSQQQWLTRNSTIGSWSNALWNMVFAGVNGAPAQSFPEPAYTTLATNPQSREKPFLYVDADGAYRVYVPDAQVNGVGPTWTSAQTPGHSLPISSFFVAKPTDSVSKINSELARGKNLILTPGIYKTTQTIEIKRPDTIVLGLGLASIWPTAGNIAMRVADVKGVEISDVIFDAGAKNSPVLLQVGSPIASLLPAGHHNWSDPSDPSVLSDVYFRIGGAHVGKATVSLLVNSNNVILDNNWIWRADHGLPGTVGWTINTADTGLIVTGNNVVATGLFVEHFQKTEAIWAGQNGKIIFVQNEMPYDVPNQAAWTQKDGTLGYPVIQVTNNVKTFEGWAWGSYAFFNVNPIVHATRAFLVPVKPGIKLHDILTLSISNSGAIDHVVNDTGAMTPSDTTRVNVVSFP